jgi:hypothetical protein
MNLTNAPDTWPMGSPDPHKGKPYPHEVSCQGCRDRRRCNFCGKVSWEWRGHGRNVDAWPSRCTNGRCMDCCSKHCKHSAAA